MLFLCPYLTFSDLTKTVFKCLQKAFKNSLKYLNKTEHLRFLTVLLFRLNQKNTLTNPK